MSAQPAELSPFAQPTPEQLERLVGIGMSIAKASGSIRRSHQPKAYIFLPQWVEQPLGEQPYNASVQRVAGRVGRIGYRAYQLWLREGLSLLRQEATEVIGPSGERSDLNLSNRESGYINLYSFTWTSRHVLDATRHHRQFRREGNGLAIKKIKKGGRERSIVVAGMADVIDLSRHRGEVTSDDCDRLIEQLRNFGEAAERAA